MHLCIMRIYMHSMVAELSVLYRRFIIVHPLLHVLPPPVLSLAPIAWPL